MDFNSNNDRIASFPNDQNMAEIDRTRFVNNFSIELVHYPPVDKRWVQGFLKPHTQLKVRQTHPIDATQQQSTKQVINRWFNDIAQDFEENIVAENVNCTIWTKVDSMSM